MNRQGKKGTDEALTSAEVGGSVRTTSWHPETEIVTFFSESGVRIGADGRAVPAGKGATAFTAEVDMID